jgi:cation transport ATPase
MNKRKSKKNKERIIQYETINISQEKMIEIQAEAYYKALKRIEGEKANADKQRIEKKKDKWYENVLFVLNVLFCPWIINKKFNVSNQIYDSILVLVVSGVLCFTGGFMWFFGLCAIVL